MWGLQILHDNGTIDCLAFAWSHDRLDRERVENERRPLRGEADADSRLRPTERPNKSITPLADRDRAPQSRSPSSSRLGRNPGQHFIAAILTNAATHALEPQAMPVNVGSLRAAVLRWSLSKAELIETVAAELSGKTLRLTKAGDADKLRSELEHLEREVRRSGTVSFAAA
jgi:hypothetical protein